MNHKELSDFKKAKCIDYLATGEWRLNFHSPWDALTDEANRERAWSVERTTAPFCDKEGNRIWCAPNPLKAFIDAQKALGFLKLDEEIQ